MVLGTDDSKDEKDAEFIREVLKAIPNFDDMIRSLMEAVPFGFAYPEVMWATDGRCIYVESIDDVPAAQIHLPGQRRESPATSQAYY